MKKIILTFSCLSLLVFSGCFSSEEENNTPLTDITKPYSLEEVNASEKIIIEEFSDIECPACKSFSSVYERIEKDFPQVEFRYYHFPLERIHDYAFPAAIATECALKIGGQEARNKYLHAAFNKDKLSIPFFRELAKEQGLDEEKFNTCFNDQETKNIVKAHVAEGKIRELSATPTLFFNGEKVTGGMTYDSMYAKIQKLLDEKK